MGCVEVYAVRLNATHDIFDQAWCVPGLTPLWLASRLDFMGCVEVYAVRLNATHDMTKVKSLTLSRPLGPSGYSAQVTFACKCHP